MATIAQDETKTIPTDNPYFRMLGYYGNTIYIYSYRTAQLIEFSATTPPRAISNLLAPQNWWEKKFLGLSGAKFREIIIEYLIRQSQQIGMFNPNRVRGRGAWIDKKGVPLLHLGDRIMIEGKTHDIKTFKSNDGYIYLANYPMEIESAEPMTDDEGREFIKLCSRLSFNDNISGKLLAGWIMCAPFCGALKWRSHIYITGQAGSGKSFVLNNIIKKALGHLAIDVQGNTSEAGIRQAIASDARPVIFDEFDPQGQFQRERLQEIVGLARQASTPDGAPIIKGSQGQNGALVYHVRSCFCLSSVEVFIKDIADRQRFTILRLLPQSSEENKEKFKQLQTDCRAIITEDFPSRLIARGAKIINQIRSNQEVFADEGETIFGKRRISDQMSMMLSGLYALQHDDFITAEKAKTWFKKHEWEEQKQLAEESKEYDLLDYILSKTVEFPLDHGGRLSRMVSEVIYVATLSIGLPNSKLIPDEARDILNRWGFRFLDDKLIICKNSDFLKSILKDTHWTYPCYETLLRIPAITTSGKNKMRFNGRPEYFIVIPKNLYLREPEEHTLKAWEE